MPREAEPSLNEKNFLLEALQENLRLDGRGFTDYRPLELGFGDEHGVAEVRLGKTRLEWQRWGQQTELANCGLGFSPKYLLR